MGTKDTVLDGAELIINDIRAIVECCDCGEQFSLMDSADANNESLLSQMPEQKLHSCKRRMQTSYDC